MTVLRVLLPLFANPLLVILLLSAVVSAYLGDHVGASIIAAIVLLSVILDAVLGFRSQRAAERLRNEVAPTASTLRDGIWQELARRLLVPGDVIRLSAGDHVPADARLIDSRDLHVQQAALTGESVNAEKEALLGPDTAGGSSVSPHMVLLGSSVVTGTAIALVVATGTGTAYGDTAETLATRPPETGFERGLHGFARLIMRTVVFLLLFVLLVNLAMGRPGLESLQFAIALAVGLTPEFMPMITTVTLARGAVRMAHRGVIVKHLAAIENFGSMDLLLSDKTGTLTTGDMSLIESLDGAGHASGRPTMLACLNSLHQTGIHSGLDAAILAAYRAVTEPVTKLDEIPFDFERRRLSVVLQTGQSRQLISKGAPEAIVGVATRYEHDGEEHPLDNAARARCAAVWNDLGGKGFRVLAVAWRCIPAQPRYSPEDEHDLVLAGFLAFADPPVAGVADTLRAIARDGIAVKILTGDNEQVARHVCEQVGIDGSCIVLGDAIDSLDDHALGMLAERTAVFARVAPAQKHRIVIALKNRGHVLGFLGDGINDAPSLHAADVGISVANAVDVARDAADIVLRERSLAVLHEGVLEGRRAFANVMKYLLMGTSSNFGNMFSMAAGVLFLPFLPMLPTQILLNNFLYDLAQIAIPTDNVDATQLGHPQRWDIGLIRDFMLWIGPISSLYDFLTFYVLIRWLHASETLFHTGWFIESLATQILVLFVIRTAGNPLRSRPSVALAIGAIAVLVVGIALPTSPLAARLGFAPLPAPFFAFLLLATTTYLLLVQAVKRRLLVRLAM